MTQENGLSALEITDFPIDDDCVGAKWIVKNDDQLSKLIALVVMGQAAQAAYIIDELIPAAPAFTNARDRSFYYWIISGFSFGWSNRTERQHPHLGVCHRRFPGTVFLW